MSVENVYVRLRRWMLVDSSDDLGDCSEFATLAAAYAAATDVDAILMAPDHGQGRDADADEIDELASEPLTARQIQVLELLKEGLPNKAIARRLGISDQTVKFHVASLSGTLRAANRTDAVRRAVRLNRPLMSAPYSCQPPPSDR